jgi:diphthine synthase
VWIHHPFSSEGEKKLTTGISIISIGLSDERDLSLRGLEECRKCDVLYAELYTSILNTSVERLSSLIGRPVKEIRRFELEEEVENLIEKAKHKRIGILVGGDCFSATTHMSLLLEGYKKGIRVDAFHGSSVFTAIGEIGLSLYKYGATVTVPFGDKGSIDAVLDVLRSNRESGLHTLILMDLDAAGKRYLTINEAINLLLSEDKLEFFNSGMLVVGVARLGWDDIEIKAGTVEEIVLHDFGDPPHALVIPGRLHFLEREALVSIAGCSKEALGSEWTGGILDGLLKKYLKNVRRVLDELKMRPSPHEVTDKMIEELIDHSERYLEDAVYYSGNRKATSLASVGYVEGILDALKILKLVEFEW